MQLQQERLREIQPRAANCWMVSTFLGEVGEWKMLSSLCSLLRNSIFFYQELAQLLGFHPHETGKKSIFEKKNHKKQKANNQTKIPKHITNLSLFARQKYFFHRYPQKCSVTWVPYGLSELMSLSSLLLFSKRSTYSPSFKEISQQILHQ